MYAESISKFKSIMCKGTFSTLLFVNMSFGKLLKSKQLQTLTIECIRMLQGTYTSRPDHSLAILYSMLVHDLIGWRVLVIICGSLSDQGR